jgi:hypothetical protein
MIVLHTHNGQPSHSILISSPLLNLIFNVNNTRQPQTSLCQWVYSFKETGNTLKQTSPAQPHGVRHILGCCVYRAHGNLFLDSVSIYVQQTHQPTCVAQVHEITWNTRIKLGHKIQLPDHLNQVKLKNFVFQEIDVNEDFLKRSPFYK